MKSSLENGETGEKTVPDGGWGWMVALGCYVMVVTLPGMSLSFSILFSTFLLDLGVSSTTTAWIFNSHLLLWNLVGPLTGPLTTEFGFRKVCMICAGAGATCLILCSFATSAEFLLVAFGMGGLFGGLGCKPCYLIIANYFKRRRGLATAIMMAGMCTGQFAGPPLIRLLQETYGSRGATLIIGGIMLHSVAGAALFQPVQWHMKKEATSKDLRKQEKPVDKQEDSSLINTSLTNPHAPLPLRNKRLRQVSESSASLHLSTVDISGYPTICEEDPDDYGSETSQDNPKTNGAWILIGRVFRLTIADLKILKSPPALIIALGGLLSQNGYLNFMLMMPFAVQAHGYALQDAAWCVSVAGICNLVARLGTTTLSDCSWFNMRLVYVLGACIFGSASLIFTFVTDIKWMMAIAGVWGFGVGVNISLFTLVMARIVGVENLAALLGASSLLVAFGFITLGPLIGLIRDVSSSYDVAIWVMVAEVMLFVLLWLCMPAAIRYERKAKEGNEHNTDNQNI